MKYNTAIAKEQHESLMYLFKLIEKESVVEIKKISPKRSLNQNSYLHLIIAAFGSHFGYTLEEAKQIYKEINKDIYIYKKKDRVFFRSSADLTQEEMAKSIDRFMTKSAESGYELPPATDQEWLRWVENETEKTGYYN